MASAPPIPIAIIGMSCRFPGGANNPEQLWDMLAEGKSAWTEVPADRFNWKSFHHPSPEARGAQNSRGGHFIDQDISEFDNLFFGITPEEAASLDPQQRLQLMTAYEALENAGIPIESVRGSDTSVHIAVVSRDYDRMIYKDPSDIPKYHLTGCGDATVCGRISYFFDFRGSSVTLDTGCSGSMVGLHQACVGLRLGESSMAVVGGTNLLLGPDMTIAMSMLHMLNDDGRCYSFDRRGSGYGRAEGVSTIVLKRLDDALLAGDPIRAVIRNSGINQDGKTNGILLPSSESQQALARTMYEAIELDPCTVDYIEAHGTGTAAGDAAELNSISSVFCDKERRSTPLYVGSVKANIGHLESSSGLAGILKTVLSMEKRLIPPVPNIIKLKENLNLDENNILIPRDLQVWPNHGTLNASINSFGFGGTNSHVILESAPSARSKRNPGLSNGFRNDVKLNGTNGTNGTHHVNGLHQTKLDEKPRVFVISAKSKKSLVQNVGSLQSWLSRQSARGNLLSDLAYTLATRRSKMVWRSSFVASSSAELVKSLSSPHPTKAVSTRILAFVFTGQGAQWFAMGRELLHAESVFGRSILQSQKILLSFGASWNLLDELRKEEHNSRINESQISQPATIAIQIALVDLLRSFSVIPQAVLGHSSGEVAAAYACGTLSQESALKVAYHRGFASTWYQQTSMIKGAMIAVGIGKQDVKAYFALITSGNLSIACENSPISTTVSGDEQAIDDLKILLDRETIFNRKLKIDTAYHSHHMKIIANRYLESLGDLDFAEPSSSTKFFSSVTGEEKTSDFGASYWVGNLTSTVRFSDGLEGLISKNVTTPHLILELGPHSALHGPVRQTFTHLNNESLKYAYLPTLVRAQDARRSILDLVGRLFEQGYPVDFQMINSISSADSFSNRTVLHDLPPYSWDLTKHWHESRLSRDYRFRASPYHDLLGLRVIGSTPLEPSWRNILSVDGLPWLQEHIIDNFALFPGSGFLCMAIEAMVQMTRERSTTQSISKVILKDITFSKALIIPDSPEKVEVILSLRSTNSPGKESLTWELFKVTSLGSDGVWNEHCQGSIALEFRSSIDQDKEKTHEDMLSEREAVAHMEAMMEACPDTIDTESFYEELRKNGIDYGKIFSTIQKLHLGQCQAVANVQIPDVAACMPSGHLEPHLIHPATFDALMHIALPLYRKHCSEGPAMLISIDEVTVSADIINSAGGELTVACDLTPTGPFSGSVDVSVFQPDINSTSRQVLTLSGQTFRGIGEGHAIKFKSTLLLDLALQVDFQEFQPSALDDLPKCVGIVCKQESNETKILSQELLSKLLSQDIDASLFREIPLSRSNQMVFCVFEDALASLPQKQTLNSSQHSIDNFTMIVNCNTSPDRNSPSTSRSLSTQETVKQSGVVNFGIWGDIVNESQATDSILRALASSFSSYGNRNPYERDFVYNYEQTKVPHLAEATAFSEWAARVDGKQTIELGPLHHKDRVLKLQVQAPGLLDSFIFVDDESYRQPLSMDELEIEVKAHAVNQKDVVVAMGRLPSSTPMIGEIAGIVTSVGSNAQTRFKIGDRVCGFGGSSYRTKSRMNLNLAHRLPKIMTFAEGASIPYAFQTAYHALVEIANLQRGETILIHSALSSVGLAAISIAEHIGAEVFATVSSELMSKRETLITFRILPDHIFSNASNSFRKSIHRMTKGRGVHVVLNTLPGMLADTRACIADFGTIVDISKSKEPLPPQSHDKSVTFASIDMASLAVKRPEKIRSIFSKVMSLFNEGAVEANFPVTEISITNIVEAFRLVQLKRHTSKVVLIIDENTQVQQRSVAPSKLQLSGTYLIAGGEYDIVMDTILHMVAYGANKIILLAKHDPRTTQNRALDGQISLGIDIEVIPCDSDYRVAVEMKDRGIVVNGIVQFGGFDLSGFEGESLEFFIDISLMSSTSELRNSASRNPKLFSLTVGTLSAEAYSLALEYAMGPQSKLDQCDNLLIGLNQDTIAATDKLDPFFNILHQASEISDAHAQKKGLADATSIQDAETMASQLITTKLAALVAIDEDDMDLNIPFSELGLDSLVAIEFKSWIVRNFSSPMQTSEILDASSIRGLASLVVKRSTLLTADKRETWNGVEQVETDNTVASPKSEPQRILNSTRPPIINEPKLPPLPLPDLESTLQLYLNSVRAFCSDKEFAHTYDAVNEFQKPGGLGRKLHSRLAKLANDSDCWVEDLYNNSNFLDRRVQLVPFSNFFFTHKLSAFPHSQAERAAIVAGSVFQYQQLLEANKLPAQFMNEQPVCTFLDQWLFNTARRPVFRRDTMHKFPGNEYFVALSRGRVFKVHLVEVSKNVTFKKLKATFDAILGVTRDNSPKFWTGILTADERNAWAAARAHLQEISESNVIYLDTIEAASFVVCLDEASPTTAVERAQHYHYGDGSNRWNDKSIQFPVCSNGISGIIGDHSMMDAGTVFGLNAYVTKAILEYGRETNGVYTNGISPISLEELIVVTDDKIDSQIERVKQDFVKNTTGVEHDFFTTQGFGGAAFRSIKCPPKSAFQVIVMLASKRHFGALEPCWESASLSNFHKGRVEISQGLLPPVADFLHSLDDETSPLESRRKLFQEATKAHASSVTRAMRGRGIDRYLTSLRQVADKSEGRIGLFEDPIFAKTRPRKLMAHCHETGMLEQAFLLRDPEAIWLHYAVEDDCVKWSIAGPVKRTGDFHVALEGAIRDVRTLFGLE